MELQDVGAPLSRDFREGGAPIVWESDTETETGKGRATRGQTMSLMQQYLLDFIAPPIMAILWWLFSRGTATVFQGGRVSERTQGWFRKGFFVVLALGYVVMFGLTTYFHFAR